MRNCLCVDLGISADHKTVFFRFVVRGGLENPIFASFATFSGVILNTPNS